MLSVRRDSTTILFVFCPKDKNKTDVIYCYIVKFVYCCSYSVSFSFLGLTIVLTLSLLGLQTFRRFRDVYDVLVVFLSIGAGDEEGDGDSVVWCSVGVWGGLFTVSKK